MKSRLLLVVGLVVGLLNASHGSAFGAELPSARPIDLRCEFCSNPLGIDSPTPGLTWRLSTDVEAEAISAYQILVASSRELLAQDKGDLWDSGKKEYQPTIQVSYAGKSLHSGQQCFWKVRVWDQSGDASPWSKAAHWEMGLLTADDWQGNWISDGKPNPSNDEDFYKDDPAPYFRGVFNVEKPIKTARLYICGLGINEPYLNNKRIGGNRLDPAWTTYDKRSLYTTYDVTAAIQPGQNCLGVMLGNGWFNVLPMRMWGQLNLRDFMPVDRPRVIAQLNIEYRDGERATFFTGDHWKTHLGPVVRNSLYLGEVYDARREIAKWAAPEFDDSAWSPATSVPASKAMLRAQLQPPILETAEFQPTSIREIKPGVFIVDFGINLAGKVRLKVAGKAGQQVKLRFGELLYPDGTLNVMTTVCGQIKKPGVGGPGAPDVAEQSDTYILRGSDGGQVEIYEPHFTYHGFRYVEVTGFPGTPTLESLTAIRMNTDVQSAGSFSCSNELFNQIQQMCLNTFPSNLVGVQTDCPGRERFPYGDDIACACEAHLYNYDMSRFYAKTVRDFADAARPNGALTLLAPWTGHAIGGFDPGGGSFADKARNGDNAGSGPLSGVLAHSLLLWKAHQVYGDHHLVREQYEVARRSLDFVAQQAPDHIVRVGLGDWCSVTPTKTEILDTALYYQHATLVAKLAAVVGESADAEKYAALARQIKQAFVNTFVDIDPAESQFNTQAALACGLYHGLIPQGKQAGIVERLVDDVKNKSHGSLTTGIFGAKYLLDVLAEFDHPEVAFNIVNRRDYPGWGYMLERGATTLWEDWQFSDDVYSHNHSMFGTVSAWFFSALGGIKPADDAVAFDKIILQPHVVPALEWVNCSHKTVRGEIVSNWRVSGDRFDWEVVIPPTATATIYLPRKFSADVRINDIALPSAIETGPAMGILGPGRHLISASRTQSN